VRSENRATGPASRGRLRRVGRCDLDAGVLPDMTCGGLLCDQAGSSRREETMRIGSTIVAIWLLIGLLAAWQRDYFDGGDDPDCERASTIAVTIIAGPLNYVGVNPKVEECGLPEPSE
jgi:hypothetical protein